MIFLCTCVCIYICLPSLHLTEYCCILYKLREIPSCLSNTNSQLTNNINISCYFSQLNTFLSLRYTHILMYKYILQSLLKLKECTKFQKSAQFSLLLPKIYPFFDENLCGDTDVQSSSELSKG